MAIVFTTLYGAGVFGDDSDSGDGVTVTELHERVTGLDILPNLHDSPAGGASAWPTLAPLLEAAERIDEGHPIPAHLEAIFVDGTALGGARPKASIRDETGVLWLAKFPSRHDAFDVSAPSTPSLRSSV